MAVEKRASFADEPYWGRPIAGWGAREPRLLIVGLAPAAHGANRTGRVFTGDRSGDWLFASLHRVGLANQPTSVHAADGLELFGARMVATVRCAPPQNKPTVEERERCAPWLDAELALVSGRPAVRRGARLDRLGRHPARLPLGRLDGAAPQAEVRPRRRGRARPARRGDAGPAVVLLGSYHPSQQNTFTGKLTEQMLDDVLGRAAGMML